MLLIDRSLHVVGLYKQVFQKCMAVELSFRWGTDIELYI
jgi:hypothetical protein